MDEHFDTLAAWADGEPVDRAAVLRALETADGRDYVMDLMALRRMVTVTTPGEAGGSSSLSRTSGPQDLRTSGPRWRLVPAAAAAVLCVAVGYGAGRFSAAGGTPQTPVVMPASAPAPSSAPAPTHVIRFEAGVDWRETAGGN
jgi:hypothetical protein